MKKQITESQRNQLKSKIKRILRESIFENGFNEDLFMEKKKKKSDKKSKKYEKDDSDSREHSVKRSEVMKWLDSAQELHSVLAYRLWPDMDDDTARSLFSKKYRGEDSDGNSYSFDDEDINKLFNMKDRFIDSIS